MHLSYQPALLGYLLSVALIAGAARPAQAGARDGWAYSATDYCLGRAATGPCVPPAELPISPPYSISGDSAHGDPARPSLASGGGGVVGSAPPPSVAATASTAGRGTTLAGFASQGPYSGYGFGEAWVNYTFSIASTTYKRVAVQVDMALSVTSTDDGAAGVQLSYTAGDTPLPTFLTGSKDGDFDTYGVAGAVAHDGHVFEFQPRTYENYFNDAIGVDAYQIVTSKSVGTSLTDNDLQVFFLLATNTDYTFQIDAFGGSGTPQGGSIGFNYVQTPFATGAPSDRGDQDQGVAGYDAVASIDPTFTVVADPSLSVGDPGNYQFVGLPEGANGNLPVHTISAPEPSTWAMLLAGFAGLGFAGYRVRLRRLRFSPEITRGGGHSSE